MALDVGIMGCHMLGGLLEIGILPQPVRVYLPEARDGWIPGWATWEAGRFTLPFARFEQARGADTPLADPA